MLVIGYGNTLRRDDGVGPQVAEWIEGRGFPGVQTLSRHQLTPELADPISRARQVVFVDASLDASATQVRVRRVQARGDHQVMAHTVSPHGLLHLAQSVFNAAPSAWLVEIPVQDTGIGEALSPRAQTGVHQAVEIIERLLLQKNP